jgi:hypothetical protein
VNPKFVNWPGGLDWQDHTPSSHWWWPWQTPLFTWIEQKPPLIWDDGNGNLHRLTTPTGNTDFGSIPGIVQCIPGLNPLRFKVPYCFHDDAYHAGNFNISTDGGVTWHLSPVSEREANDRLEAQILHDPADPGNALEAETIWAGVEAGGWMSWKKGGWQAKLNFIRARKHLLLSRKYDGRIDPYGGGGIIRMA